MQDPPSPDLQNISAYLPHTILRARVQDPSLPRVRGGFAEGAVLFADISGFTAMSERLSQLGKAGAEEVTAILNRCFTALLDTLYTHGGDLFKFGGDALTAFFPGDERQAAVAVQTALRMQEAMRAFQETLTSAGTFRLEMRVGINWGRVFLAEAGSERRLEIVLSGSVVNRTAAAEAAAEAGEVAVTAETFALLGEGFAAEPVDGGFCRIARQRQETPIRLAAPVAIDICALGRAGGIELLRSYLVQGLYEKLLAQPAEVEGEHRWVTVLFIHFWGIDYDRDPGATEKLTRYIALVEETAYRYGGVLNKSDIYTHGDKLMILFGAPFAHENDEERTIRCALDIRAESLGFDLHHRFGINAGYVFAGVVGSSLRKEYTVMGDTVNLAARVMALAAEGQIAVSEAVQRKTAAQFSLQFLGKRSVKGKAAAIPVYEVGALLEQRTRPVQEKRRLVGRENERELLRSAAHQALSGESQLLVLVGEAGIGKSCLAEDLLDHCRVQGMQVFAAECPFYGAYVPYSPWAEILKGLLGIHESNPAEAKRERLVQGMTAATAHLVPWAPVLGEILGISLPDTPLTISLEPGQRKARVFEVVLDLVRHRAAQAPLVLLLEDIHWMDDLSRELLDDLVQTIRGLPLLVIALSRPDPRLAELNALEQVIVVHLSELADEAVRDLIVSLLPLPEIPPPLCDLILVKSQGNPFFIEEVIRTLTATGLIREQGGVPRITSDLATVEIPDTIQRLITSRIDDLGEGSKSLIKVASVLGRQFRYSFLRGLCPREVDDQSLQERLAGLADLGLLLAREAEPDTEYLFRHVLIQEMAYDSLPFARRKALHHEVGCYIETSFPEALEDHYELLAYHYSRTDDAEKAIDYLMKAATKTKRLYANQTALNFYLDALRRLAQGEEGRERAQPQIECHFGLGEIRKLIGQYPEAQANYEAALPLAKQLGDPQLQAKAYQSIGQLKNRTGEYAEARLCLTQSLDLAARAGGDRALEASLLNDLGNNHYRMGDSQTALDYFERSLAIRRELGDKRREAFCEMNMGVVHSVLGARSRAIGLLEQAYRVFQEVGDQEMEARVLANLSDVRMDSGDYRGAEQECLKALGISEAIGDREAELMMLERLGGINARLGAYPDALARFQRALALAQQLGNIAQETIALNNIAQAHWDLGDYRQALDACQAALKKARTKVLRAQETEALALHTLGLIAGSLSDASAALGFFQEAERIAGEIGNSSLQVHVRINIGRRLLATGKGAEAVRMIAEELDKARQAGYRELELYGLVSLAVAHLYLGDLQRARESIAEVERQNAVVQDKAMQLQMLKLQAEIAGRTAGHPEALERYGAALELTRALQARKEEGWILHGMGEVLRQAGDEVRAMAHHQEAIRLAIAMGDRPLQQKLLADFLHLEHDLLRRATQGDQEAARHGDQIQEWIEELKGTRDLAIESIP